MNRLTQSQLPTSAKTAFAYTDSNNGYAPSKITTPEGGSTTYAYDSAGNVQSATDSTSAAGQGSVTRYTDGAVHTSTDANGHVTTNTDNGTTGLLMSVARPSPLGGLSYTYDSLARLHTATDGNGVTTTYTYDADDRVKSVATGSTTVSYTYDPAGNRTSRVDSSGTTTTTYDALNRITAQTLSVGGSTSYSYDGVGNLLTLTDVSGTTHYDYNAVNLVDQIVDPAGTVTTLAYTPDNQRRLITFASGVQQTTDYDASDRVLRIRGISPTSTSLTDLNYTYANSSGNDTDLRQSVHDNVANTTTAYTYDQLNRLTAAATTNSTGGTVTSYSYSYDKVGNITSSVANGATTTAAFNAADERCWSDVAAVGSPTCSSPPSAATTFSYDAAGNLTVSTPASGAPTTTSYNSLNQTTAQGPLTFTYGGTGQSDRVGSADSSSGGQAYTFTQSLLGLTTRSDTTDGSSSTYTRDNTGNLISTITGAGTEDYLTDGLGSVIATVDSSGAIDQRYAYKPFGLLASTNTGDPNPYRFTGQYQDVVTGT